MRHIYLQRQRFTVTSDKRDIVIGFDIDEDKITLYNGKSKKDFVFTNRYDRDTLEYWAEILKCMQTAVEFAKKNIDVKRDINVKKF